MTHFEVLDLPLTASVAEVKHSYRRLAAELHPDRTGDDPVRTERFVRITNAYNALKTEAQIQAYRKSLPGDDAARPAHDGTGQILAGVFHRLVEGLAPEGPLHARGTLVLAIRPPTDRGLAAGDLSLRIPTFTRPGSRRSPRQGGDGPVRMGSRVARLVLPSPAACATHAIFPPMPTLEIVSGEPWALTLFILPFAEDAPDAAAEARLVDSVIAGLSRPPGGACPAAAGSRARGGATGWFARLRR